MRNIEKSNFTNRAKLSYDPDDVNIRLQHFRISEIISMVNSKSISEDFDFLADYSQHPSDFEEDEYIDLQGDDGLQRNNDLWNNVQKSQFIESLMINLPVPLFYFDGSTKPWRIIDGLQRLYTIISFINGNYTLTGLEYLSECDKSNYNNIPGYLRKRILDAEIIAYVINPGTPPDVKYNIFKRINTGGLKLNGQEIRNAFFRGVPATFTRTLAEVPIFKLVTNNKVTTRRMTDREYANRFIAFQVFSWEDYNGKMDVFLSEALLDLYDRSEEELYRLESAFNKSMNRCYELFEEIAFYRIKLDSNIGRQPNKAIFDTLSWNIGEISDNDFNNLVRHRRSFKKAYIEFINTNQLMYHAVNDTTGSKTAVFNRFYELKTFLTNFLNK